MNARPINPRLCGLFIGLLSVVCYCCLPLTETSAQRLGQVQRPERWQGALDLHQGDTGTLEFSKKGAAIEGTIKVTRGSNEFEDKISGTWKGQVIEFRRELSATSGQPFLGIAVTADDGKVKMGGRFAFRYAGVWSADCERVRTLRPFRVR